MADRASFAACGAFARASCVRKCVTGKFWGRWRNKRFTWGAGTSRSRRDYSAEENFFFAYERFSLRQAANELANQTGVDQTQFQTGSRANTFQFADDATLIRGHQQITFGVDYIYRQLNEFNVFNGNGSFTFNGQFTSDPLLDFILGTPNSLVQGNPEQTGVRQNYIALYGQDNVQINPKLNVHVGLRWEPFLPETDVAGRGVYFSQSAFNAGAKTSKYTNAPIGLQFAGDPGVPSSYINGKMANFSPRIGLVFDPSGKGKESIRASYNVFHDTPNLYFYAKWADSAPWGSTVTLTPPGTLGNLYSVYPGGNPFPFPFPPSASQPFPTNGTYYSFPVQTRPTYAQVWGLSYQRQVGGDWLLSADYLGSKTTHLWSGTDQNHAVYIPGNCVAGQYGLTAPGACSTTGNVAARRVLTLANPSQGPYYGALSLIDDGGTGSYNALLFSVNHRLSSHFSLLGNWTWAHCIADPISQYIGGSYSLPSNRRFDRGNCVGGEDQRQNVNVSIVAESPRFSQKFVQMIAGNWRLATTASIRTGSAISVTTGISENLTGLGGDRPNQVLSNPYCAVKSVSCWINPAAFAYPATGTYGNLGVDSLVGPGYFGINMGLSRAFVYRERNKIEIRAEAFNLENRINLATPVLTLSSSTFGQINAEPAGNGAVAAQGYGPRIMQFSIKYLF